jgi:hypothetical protein
MKLSNLSALNQHYVKRLGVIFASIFIILGIVAKLTGTWEEIDVRLVNLYILVALSLTVFSKEKTDDERTQIVRYFAIKMSFRLLIAGLAAIYLLNFKIDLIYIAISSLIIYLLIFYLSSYFNPSFIFKEETKTNKGSIKFIVGIMVFIGIAFLYNIIKAIIVS